jgi:hypothetical protein
MNICYLDSVMSNLPLENKGSLITIAGTNTCLGYLMAFKDRGVFDATHGKVDITPEDAAKHNAILDSASIKGLDETCQVGQGGVFYYNRHKNSVNTWLGTLISDKVQISPGGKVITFLRNGCQYRGLLRKNDDSFTFKRIS